MKRYKIIDMKQFISGIIAIIACLVLVWFAMSYIEVLYKHWSPNPQYSSTNFFSIMLEVIK